MASEFVTNLAAEQRKRLVSSLMGYFEKNVFTHLTPAEQKNLREKVLSSVGIYHDNVLDMLKASVSDGTEFNEAAIDVLQRLADRVERLVDRKSDG